ncbi:B2 bradykinin receptor-like [Hippoglossus hippoglossus]|uniref:B2 bradykinin receptor-like n=1 Tax=Hippoglossus hippoglossus TaxID=8267 RepID=UPI00148D0028|nr:B2 bradykinin receptor-like [Hippoglossus hippoglossus]XP_035024163.1 B2 bradykinin receptor [Hippoglossus stenolepis]
MTLVPTSVPDLNTTVLYGYQNETNVTQCPEHGWDWLTASQPVYILILTVLGVVLNVFVLMVFCLNKKPCTVAEIYLSNLAAADLLLLSCLPFWAINLANDFNWPFGLFMCKVVNLGIQMNVYSSIYFLVLVSIDRYLALVHPLSHGRMRRPKYAKLGCLLIWSFGLIMGVPTIVFRKLKYFPEYDVNACYLDYPNYTVEMLCDRMLIIFSFVVPISIISFCTFKIIQTLRVQSVERFSAEKTEQKATTLILAVLLAFLICWVPFHLLTVLDLLQREEVLGGCHFSNVLDILHQISSYLAFFNSVLNPILYVIVGKNFRKKAGEVFKQWNIKRRATMESTSSHLSCTLKTVK